MSGYNAFEETASEVALKAEITPFWARKSVESYKSLDEEESARRWIKSTHDTLYHNSSDRANRQIMNLALYRGVHFKVQDRTNADFRNAKGAIVTQKTNKLILPELHEATNARVAKLTQFKPTTIAYPSTAELSDRQGARAVDRVLETIAYQFNKDKMIRQTVRRANIFGETYVFILWNPDKGDIHPAYIKAQEALAEQGETRGEVYISGYGPVEIDPDKPPLRIGDIDIKTPLPWDVFLDPKPCPAESEWVMWSYWEHVEKTKRDHPDKASKITKHPEDAYAFNPNYFDVDRLENHALVIEFWHRSNKYQPGGAYVKIVGDVILTDGVEDNPYPEQESSEWGNLPIERLTDIDIDGVLYGMSSYQLLAPLAHSVNQFWTMAKSAMLFAGHPKVLVPEEGGINLKALGNDKTIVKYRGGFKPETMVASPISPGLIPMAQELSQKFQSYAGSHPVSKGTPPPGIRAGIAIRLLEEIENQRSSDLIEKQNSFVVDLDKKILATVGQFYRTDDGRLLNILGKDQMPLVESFDVSILNKPWDIRIAKGSSLPKSPAARVQTVLDIVQIFGLDFLPKEQWADMLDLKQPDKFYDMATAAVRVAEWENEEFSQGRTPPEPRQGEDYYIHWQVHSTFYQTPSYLRLTPKQQERYRNHQLATEYLMWLHAQENPTFAQLLLQERSFPMFFVQPKAPPAPLPGQALGGPGPQGPGAPMPQQQVSRTLTTTQGSPDQVLTPPAPVQFPAGG